MEEKFGTEDAGRTAGKLWELIPNLCESLHTGSLRSGPTRCRGATSPRQQQPEDRCAVTPAAQESSSVLTRHGSERARQAQRRRRRDEEVCGKLSEEDFLTLFLYLLQPGAACQSLMPQRGPPLLNAHYDQMRSAGKSPLLINTFPAYLEIFWSQRQFAFWETASLYRLSNNSFVQHLPVV